MTANRTDLALIGVLLFSLAGCQGVHFHNQADAKRAAKAVETYESVELFSVIETGIANVDALTAAEIETKKNLDQAEAGILTSDILGSIPTTGDQPAGWPLLLDDTNKALESFGLSLFNEPERIESLNAEIKESLANLEPNTLLERLVFALPANVRERRDEIETHEELVSEFHDFYPDHNVLPTDCEKTPRNRTQLDKLFDKEGLPDGEAKEDYGQLSLESCNHILELQAKIEMANRIVNANEDVSELAKLLTKTRVSVADRKSRADSLRKSFKEAERELARAEKALSDAADGDNDALDALKKKLADSLEKLEELGKKAADLPLVGDELNADLLGGLVTRVNELAPDQDSAEAIVAKGLLSILKTNPGISRRLGYEAVPSVNVLLLELALQRLNYQMAFAQFEKEKSELGLLEQSFASWQDELQSWVQVATALRARNLARPDLTNGKPLVKYLPMASPEEQEDIIRALVAYNLALSDRARREMIGIEQRNLIRRTSLEASKIALTAWNDLIRVPLNEVKAYHDGGITTEEIAALINAVGLTAIAVGVN